MNSNTDVLKSAGVDTDDLAERFGGSADLIMKFMKKFLQDGSFSMLKDAMERGSRDEAVLHAHTLKGVAGNLSMKELYESASRLEAVLRGREEGNEKEIFKKLSSRYERITEAISGL